MESLSKINSNIGCIETNPTMHLDGTLRRLIVI